MTAYYNENNPKAAAWLRELIRAGHIADGYVDERSITEVDAVDVAGYTQCHFFAGIGGWSYALRLAGWSDNRPVWTGSCPCQPFSTAGKRQGTADERHLWPEFFRLIRERRPAIIFGEQVASKDALAWLDAVYDDMEGAGYAVGAADLCAAGVGAPHIRQRLYWMAHASSYTGHKRRELESHRRQDNAEQNWLGSRTDWVANADNTRPQGRNGNAECANQCAPWQNCMDVRPGPTKGHWRDADWLYCRDGKWRSVEPGTFPLAYGIPARVVRLRGYGNAIVPQVAAAFVRAFMEIEMPPGGEIPRGKTTEGPNPQTR